MRTCHISAIRRGSRPHGFTGTAHDSGADEEADQGVRHGVDVDVRMDVGLLERAAEPPGDQVQQLHEGMRQGRPDRHAPRGQP